MRFGFVCGFAVALAGTLAGRASALHHVSLKRDGQTYQVSGRLITDAQDGGLLVLGQDGRLWAIQPDEIVDHRQDEEPFEPLGAEPLAQRVLAELPADFEVYRTANYTIFHNTSKVYAQWCGALFERLNRGFTNFWERRGMPLRDPEVPLVAFVFKDKESYVQYARQELGEAAVSIVGFYSLTTNRVTTYNLTGVDAQRPARRLTSAAQINQVLSSPEATRTVATLVHEATHQLGFNCGLHARWADVPMWVSEGIAVFFETPDLSSSKGWRTVGAVNRGRLAQFHRYLQARPADSLQTLVADDTRFRDAETALNAYAEAWALNYYLLSTRPADYVKYLGKISAKRPLVKDSPEQRLQEFRSELNTDLGGLDEDFVDRLRRLR